MPTTSPSGRPRRPAQAVTSARRSVEADRSRRMRQYLIAMGIRTAAFPLAVWAFVTERYALAWVAAFLAVVIPSFAVMVANAVDTRVSPATSRPESPTRRLGTAPAATTGDRVARPGGEVLHGEVLRGEVVGGPAAAPREVMSPDGPAGTPSS